MHTLIAENVSKSFINHKALDDVSISVPDGAIFGLLGPNGAGKTTLIRIINQIYAPDNGRIIFNGNPIRPDDVEKIGYLPEERGLYKKMKVGEQALYLAQLKGLSRYEALKRLKYWFEKFEIQAWWDKKVEELSKGMAQKVQFIVTVIHQPKLIIFDEPFSGFDPINANLLKDEMIDLKRQGSTIIFSTHNMSSVEELCDHVALINRSKKILDGRVEEIREQYKTNTFQIDFAGAINGDFNQNPEIQVVKTEPFGKLTRITVNLTEALSPNDVLKYFIQYVDIHGFSEVLPSMNDIFIRVVKQFNQN
ncbi:MAG TPA: ABC transporter ATP-binding protein [Salinivirgaceae bacterium]|nr:ABC transporter ATP-binding protein [Salinivirgaceae bacterium]